MLDRLGDALFAGARRRRRCCTTGSRRSCRSTTAARELRLDLPFAEQGRRLAQEDRARAGRARRRPEAHDRAAGRAGRATGRPSAALDDGSLRGGLHRAGAGPMPAIRSRPYAAAERLVREAPSAPRSRRRGAAERRRAAAGCERDARRALRRSRDLQALRGAARRARAARSRPSSRASSPRRCASC